jgi:lysophospholipase L1-like esterase
VRKIVAAIAATLALAATVTVAQPATAAVSRPRPLVNMMPLGDSVTWGSGSRTGGGYRAPLASGLYRAGARLNMVGTQVSGPVGTDRHHQGHRGWTCGQLLYSYGRPGAGIDYWMRAARPNVVLLHCGTNDARLNVPARYTAAHLEGIIRRIRAHNHYAHVFVAMPIRTRAVGVTAAYSAELNRRLALFDRYIPGIVARAGARTYLVDMRGAVTLAGMADHLHPNGVGYWWMAVVWYRAIRYRLPGIGHWGRP